MLRRHPGDTSEGSQGSQKRLLGSLKTVYISCRGRDSNLTGVDKSSFIVKSKIGYDHFDCGYNFPNYHNRHLPPTSPYFKGRARELRLGRPLYFVSKTPR